jgi:hypothetical protein
VATHGCKERSPPHFSPHASFQVLFAFLVVCVYLLVPKFREQHATLLSMRSVFWLATESDKEEDARGMKKSADLDMVGKLRLRPTMPSSHHTTHPFHSSLSRGSPSKARLCPFLTQ